MYHVFASTNLLSWEDLGGATQTVAGVYHFVDGPAASRPLRFYRAALL